MKRSSRCTTRFCGRSPDGFLATSEAAAPLRAREGFEVPDGASVGKIVPAFSHLLVVVGRVGLGSARVRGQNQLVNKELAKAVEKPWIKRCKAILSYSRGERYLNVNFRRDRAQVAHREWLIQQIKGSSSATGCDLIRSLCFERGFLPVELIEPYFDPRLISEACGGSGYHAGST